MAAEAGLTEATKNNILDGLGSDYTNSVLEIYPSPAADIETADPGVSPLLVITEDGGTFVAGQPDNGINFASSSSAEMVLDGAEYKGDGVLNGTAVWGRLLNNDKSDWIQGTVSTGDNTMFKISTTAITVGQPVTLLSGKLRF